MSLATHQKVAGTKERRSRLVLSTAPVQVGRDKAYSKLLQMRTELLPRPTTLHLVLVAVLLEPALHMYSIKVRDQTCRCLHSLALLLSTFLLDRPQLGTTSQRAKTASTGGYQPS